MAVMKGRAVINLLAICLIVAVIAGTEISTAEGKCCWKKKEKSCSKNYNCKQYCKKSGYQNADCHEGHCRCCMCGGKCNGH